MKVLREPREGVTNHTKLYRLLKYKWVKFEKESFVIRQVSPADVGNGDDGSDVEDDQVELSRMT